VVEQLSLKLLQGRNDAVFEGIDSGVVFVAVDEALLVLDAQTGPEIFALFKQLSDSVGAAQFRNDVLSIRRLEIALGVKLL